MEKEPKFEQQTPEQPSSMRDVHPIEESRNVAILGRSELQQYVEPPLLNACEELWDKGVRTLSSSANQKDLETGHAYIIVDFDHLSLENQEIARQFAEPQEYDEGRAVKIEIPINENPELIREEAKRITDQFQEQEPTWIESFTLEQVKAISGIPEDDTHYQPEDFEEMGLFYDKESGLFYQSKELYKKAQKDNLK